MKKLIIATLFILLMTGCDKNKVSKFEEVMGDPDISINCKMHFAFIHGQDTEGDKSGSVPSGQTCDRQGRVIFCEKYKTEFKEVNGVSQFDACLNFLGKR